VTPIIETWISDPAPSFPNYEAGTWGPESAHELLARDGRKWRRI
jgi:glucose-6-phosphate 1-dehydrogenase